VAGGGGRGNVLIPKPCKKGGELVREGEMSGEICQTAKCNTLSCDEPWQVVDTSRSKRRRPFLTGDDDEVFMTRSQSTLPRKQQSSI